MIEFILPGDFLDLIGFAFVCSSLVQIISSIDRLKLVHVWAEIGDYPALLALPCSRLSYMICMLH